MKQLDFSLIPFFAKTAPEIEVTGSIFRQDNRLNIKYQLSGNLSEIIIPAVNPVPHRQYDLWNHTCFEFFLRLKNTAKYWEFNLSPAGDWNVFFFPEYRQNIAEETAFNFLPFTVSQTAEYLKLNLSIDLDPIICKEQNLDVAITTVVENRDKQLSYWALVHPATEADFHHQDSFVINL